MTPYLGKSLRQLRTGTVAEQALRSASMCQNGERPELNDGHHMNLLHWL